MRYLAQLLEEIDGAVWPRRVRVLDVGGGAGVLARLVCEWFARRGHEVTCAAVDLSAEMLERQRANNPYVRDTHLGPLETMRAERFDLALLIDVIEHVPAPDDVAASVNAMAAFVLYNIPTERNLSDWLRNVCLRGRYYPAQTESLGHVHFFSPAGARAFVRRHHALLAVRVPAFARHVLDTDHAAYRQQQQHALRRLELKVSAWISTAFGGLAPWLVQGSLFMLARTRP
jgi:SAM-dependent methyltransferase